MRQPVLVQSRARRGAAPSGIAAKVPRNSRTRGRSEPSTWPLSSMLCERAVRHQPGVGYHPRADRRPPRGRSARNACLSILLPAAIPRSPAVAFTWLGGTGVLAGSVGALAIGRLTGNDRLSEVGLHTTEAIVASGAIVGATKGIIGRQRPFLEKRDPGDFFPGHGFSNGGLASFPSGHTAAAFSAATVLSIEAHRSWPKAAPILSPLLYGGATAVGLARMYDSRHWASDVAFGATVGTLTGIQVMRYNDTHPDNRLSRWLVRTSITPNGSHGVSIGLSLPMPLVGIFPTR
jgi:membrane-associated phospholipid phosphatase